jgi:prepilin-type N-terminal cleavage/methylation domain-containing protein
MKSNRLSIHPVSVARRATRRRVEGIDDAGFTLIELLITVVILPIVLGGIAAALLAVFGLQDQTQNRIGDSNDAQVGSATFNKDVQSAEEVTTAGFATAAGCGSATTGPNGSAQTQLLGLEWGYNSAAAGGFQTVVSYVTEQLPGQTGSALVRQECTNGQSTTPSSTTTISRDFPPLPADPNNPTSSDFIGPCPSSGTPATWANCLSIVPGSVQTSAGTGWTTTQGVTGISFYITEPANQYTYTLTGLPGESTSSPPPPPGQSLGPAGCSFSNPVPGSTYARQLCFADFSSFTDTPGACQQMKLLIQDSSDYLNFCVSVSPDNTGATPTIHPQAIPTFYLPGTGPGAVNSEAFLGNNGFYTGIPGLPALSQRPQPNGCSGSACTIFQGVNSALTTITFKNVTVTNFNGDLQSGWTLVTGDAESTDTDGWLMFQNASVNWSILPNSTSSNWGNSCYDTQDTQNSPANSGVYTWSGPTPPTAAQVNVTNGSNGNTYAGALPASAYSASSSPPYTTGSKGILCESNIQLNKTGALMVDSPEPALSNAPQTVTDTLQGEGYQAVFLGVLL